MASFQWHYGPVSVFPASGITKQPCVMGNTAGTPYIFTSPFPQETSLCMEETYHHPLDLILFYHSHSLSA